MKYFVGLDIGGTKCAVVLGTLDGEGMPRILEKLRFPTEGGPDAMLPLLINGVRQVSGGRKISGIGVSCGGPLDSKNGLILSPPNLPGWDKVPITQIMEREFKVPCRLQNDADACALAEWRFGAGKGTENMVFLTCGTGFGAGLILGGRLYSGSCDMAGEIGHIRATDYGPVGYGKQGGFEGFCSGGGIAQVAKTMALEQLQMGRTTGYCASYGELDTVTAQSVAQAANGGDKTALAVYKCCGKWLGRSLALLVDLLNPQAIVIGSVFVRAENLLREVCEREISRECLPKAAQMCKILPAELGESLGDIAALAVAAQEEFV